MQNPKKVYSRPVFTAQGSAVDLTQGGRRGDWDDGIFVIWSGGG
ncbi:MAG TPA: hypothetical protein VF263_25725 [Longimicrobiaceae bacterium]